MFKPEVDQMELIELRDRIRASKGADPDIDLAIENALGQGRFAYRWSTSPAFGLKSGERQTRIAVYDFPQDEEFGDFYHSLIQSDERSTIVVPCVTGSLDQAVACAKQRLPETCRIRLQENPDRSWHAAVVRTIPGSGMCPDSTMPSGALALMVVLFDVLIGEQPNV